MSGNAGEIVVPSDPAGSGTTRERPGSPVDLGRVAKIHVALLVAAGGVAYVTRWVDPGSVLLGGAVMGVNVWLIKIVAAALIPTEVGESQGSGRSAVAIVGLLAKFAVSLGFVVVLFRQLPIDAWGFLVGVTMLLVALLVGTFTG